MRSPGRPSSALLAYSWHPVACATQPCAATMPVCQSASRLRLVDAPLPHDLVRDGLALGLLSHTSLLLPCVPRPRVQLRVDLRNLQAAHYTLPHHHDASAFITAICPHPPLSGTWQVDWSTHRSHRHLHTLDTDCSSAAAHGRHGADKSLGRLGSPAFHSLAASSHALSQETGRRRD